MAQRTIISYLSGAMTNAGPILVAVDFSRDSKSALLWGARQAELENTGLTILHVIHEPADSPGFYNDPNDDLLRAMAERSEEMMAEFLGEVRSAHPEAVALANAMVTIVPGLPAGRIVEVAGKIDSRMIVVGSRGRTGLDAILLGSVAERVVQLSRVPVVVVKASPPENTA
jgi:nucleotide-binding universal stress UspA family protein